MEPTEYFWHPGEQRWYAIIACGELSIKGWIPVLRNAGYCLCHVKRERAIK